MTLEEEKKSYPEDKTKDYLDQSAIDELFAGGGHEDDFSAEPDGLGDPEQSAIGALFNGPDSSRGADTGEDTIPQEDEGLDELFGGLDDNEEIFGDEFNFAEEIEEPPHNERKGEPEEPVVKPNREEAAAAMTGNTQENQDKDDQSKIKQGAILPAALREVLIMTGIGGLLALFFAVCLFLLMGGGKEVKGRVISPESASPPAKAEKRASRTERANFIPVAENENYRMSGDRGKVEITLQAFDRDNDSLTFAVTKLPDHGRLSGTPPDVIYQPGNDFTGEDAFRFKVDDGKTTSAEALIRISGPDLTGLAALNKETAESPGVGNEKDSDVKKLVPIQPPLKAPDVTFSTKSTDSVVLEPASLWKKMNKGDYDRTVYCKMDPVGLKGELHQISQDVYRYKSDPFFSGVEVINYRFKKSGISSPLGRIIINVTGDPPPELCLEEMERLEYAVGETVIIDAGCSRDDKRQSLKFDWEQISGVPVRIKEENSEGSRISFVMPSDFSNRENPGPLLKVSVTDERGLKDSRFVKTRSVSLRDTALWR